jgi:hypothetical protein
MPDDLPVNPKSLAVQAIRAELDEHKSTRRRRITEKFLIAAIGSIPWVGGFAAAAASNRRR